MQYRTLGKSGMRVSTIGMGCWALGGQWGPIDENTAIGTVHAALDAGVNLFDTADSYGPRTSEEMLGHALKGRRDQAIIATKVGNFARRYGHALSFGHPEHVYLSCDSSLHRLQTDYIDIYQCHIGNIDDPSVFLEAFERLLESGKIRAYAVSTDSPNVLERFDVNDRCVACQLNYSVANRRAESELLPLCQMRNTGTLIRGPLAQGVLTGKFDQNSRFTDEVRSGWNTGEAQRDVFTERLKRADRLREVLGRGRTMVDLALGFVLAHPAVTCAIPGMKSPEQAKSNAVAADVVLNEEELKIIRSISVQ